MLRKNIPFIQNKTIADPNGRFLVVSGCLCSTPVTFVNIYGPNFDCPEFFRAVFNSIPNIDQTNVIVGGDMNCVLNVKLDKRFSKSLQQSKSGQCLNTVLKNLNIVDIWRLLFPTSREFYYFSPVHKSYSRIDYFFLDSKLIPVVVDVTYHPILVSDHSPVSLTLKVANLSTRGCKNWRFDAALLKDDVFHKRMEEHIKFFIGSNDKGDVDDLVLWESLKAVMRGHIISYTAWKSKSRMQL